MAENTSTILLLNCWGSCILSLPNHVPGAAMIMVWLKAKLVQLFVNSMAIHTYLSSMPPTSLNWIATKSTGINFHRPCYFPTTITDNKGKQRKKYHYDDMMTPYEKFRSLRRPSQYLKPGVTFKKLDAYANEMTDNEAAEELNSARDYIFNQLHERLKIRA